MTVLTADRWPFDEHPVGFEAALAAGLFRGFGGAATDGDTATVLVDLGFYRSELFPVRLPGVDCPETRGTDGEEREAAVRALRRTEELVAEKPVLIRGSQDMSFRRVVAELLVRWEGLPEETARRVPVKELMATSWTPLSDVLVAEGLGEP